MRSGGERGVAARLDSLDVAAMAMAQGGGSMIRFWKRRPAPGPEARAERATAMMREALEEIRQETGCRVVFMPMPQQAGVGALVVTAGWTCVPEEALGGSQPRMDTHEHGSGNRGTEGE
jgi:hypothetical protein